MEKIEVEKEKAVRVYNASGKKIKLALEKIFGDQTLKLSIIERIKEHQDALNFKGETLEEFNSRTQFDTPGQKAGKMLEDIAFALNEGKILGRDDYWYYPWFNRVASGVGLSFLDCGYDSVISTVGSRLCVKDSNTAEYMGKQFIEIYSTYLYEQ